MSSRGIVTVMCRSQVLRLVDLHLQREPFGCLLAFRLPTLVGEILRRLQRVRGLFVVSDMIAPVLKSAMLGQRKERVMGFEPTTTTLATSCSTN